MDIQVYNYVLQGLRDYNSTVENYGNTIEETQPKSKVKFPLTIVKEVRNVVYGAYTTGYQRVSSIGFLVEIYAKDKGEHTKTQIARELALIADNYFSSIGLQRVSFNLDENQNNGSVCSIILTYNGTLLENRRRFI